MNPSKIALKIFFEYINPDYKERISSEMLLAVLKTVKK